MKRVVLGVFSLILGPAHGILTPTFGDPAWLGKWIS